MPMSRAEAAARVVAAAKKYRDAYPQPGPFTLSREGIEIVDSANALDACPPEATGYAMGIDVAAGMIATEADVQEARALAWAAGEKLAHEREWSAHYTGPGWLLAFSRGDGDPHNGWWPTRDAEHAAWAGRYRPQPAPAPAQRAAPETSSTDARLDALAAQVGVIDERLSVEEANALNDGIADRMRLTALEAQVGRVERAVRAMATRTARDMLDGGPDA